MSDATLELFSLFNLGRALERARVRLIADDRLTFVFAERTDDAHKSSGTDIHWLAEVIVHTAPMRVLLLDVEGRVSAMREADELARSALISRPEFRALCFSSGFDAYLLGATKRRSLGQKLWEISFADESPAGELTRGAAALKQCLVRFAATSADGREPLETSADEANRDTAPPGESRAEGTASQPDHYQRLIELRGRLRKEIPMISAAEWSALAGNAGRNPSAAIGKHKTVGRVFAVSDGKRDMYPAFQFDENDGMPKPGIAQILANVPEPARGWPLLSWFNAPNVLLNGKKPLETIDTDPEAVADAAERFYGRDD